jgi:hypothetical protein
MNTNLHVTARQAGSMLKAVRFTMLMRNLIAAAGAPVDALPELHELKGNETMLLAALERIRDLEARRAVR